MIKSEEGLINYIMLHNPLNLDAIVVEGYDGVGKGKVLSMLSEYYSVSPYRPDYNLWQQFDHKQSDRWKISGFFWDVYSHFWDKSRGYRRPMLFDRGVISGAVYNHDKRIAETYKSLLKNMRVLHVLVCCSKEDYFKFQEVRGLSLSKDEKEDLWNNCRDFTKDYVKYFKLAGVEYVIYCNKFNENESIDLSTTCKGCGHYNYGICRHPDINKEVDPSDLRCELSIDPETQDEEVERSAEALQCL